MCIGLVGSAQSLSVSFDAQTMGKESLLAGMGRKKEAEPIPGAAVDQHYPQSSPLCTPQPPLGLLSLHLGSLVLFLIHDVSSGPW